MHIAAPPTRLQSHFVRAIVVGGGIGGLTAAIALERIGVETVVLEQAAGPAALGASLQLGPNATRLLDELQLLDRLRAVASRPDAVDLLRWDDGSLILHSEHGDAAEEYFGAPQLDFFRPDLYRVLTESISSELQYGVRVTGVERGRFGVAAVTADGRLVWGDCLIAADGIRSGIRRLIVGADEPVFSGTVVYRGVIPRDQALDLHPDRVNRYWLGPYRHGVSYWLSGGERLAVTLGVQRAARAEESWTTEAPAEEALAYVDGWDEPLRERLRRAGSLLRGAIYVRRPIERWADGRVTLLGDAAHAMAPFQAQGAAQAIEDAYVLSVCLADGHRDPAAALERYASIRRDRAAGVQESGRASGEELFLPDGPDQERRDQRYRDTAGERPWGIRQQLWEHDVRHALG
jgi:salicylate hydroxylase